MSAPTAPPDATRDRVRSGWASKLDVDVSLFLEPRITLVPRENSKGIFALELQDSVVVLCPASLLPVLSPLSHNELLDMNLLLRILHAYQPKPFGIASIAYAHPGTLRESPAVGMTRVANSQDAQVLFASCTQSERDESGVAGMPNLFVAQSADGGAAAIAGYEAWNADIAQMGVLANPIQRGRGLAFAAASVAAQASLDAGLIPQWRVRIGNQSSYRLGQRLGFYEMGRQLAIDL